MFLDSFIVSKQNLDFWLSVVSQGSVSNIFTTQKLIIAEFMLVKSYYIKGSGVLLFLFTLENKACIYSEFSLNISKEIFAYIVVVWSDHVIMMNNLVDRLDKHLFPSFRTLRLLCKQYCICCMYFVGAAGFVQF